MLADLRGVKSPLMVFARAFRDFLYYYVVAAMVLLSPIAAARRLLLPSHRRDE